MEENDPYGAFARAAGFTSFTTLPASGVPAGLAADAKPSIKNSTNM